MLTHANQKKAKVAIIISDRVEFRVREKNQEQVKAYAIIKEPIP